MSSGTMLEDLPAQGTEAAAVLESRYLLPVYRHLDLEPVRGEGVWLIEASGRRLLDLYGGHAVVAARLRPSRLVEAVARQAKEMAFQTNVVPNRRPRARRRGAGRLRARRARQGVPRQQRRRGERERAAPRLPQDRPRRRSWRSKARSTAAPRRPPRSPGAPSAGTASRASRSTSSSCRAATSRRSTRRSTTTTAAVIVEPVQGLAGAIAARQRVPRGGAAAHDRARRAAHLRRGPVRPRPARHAVRGAALRRDARLPDPRQGARRRLPGGGACWPAPKRCRRSPTATSAPPSAAARWSRR